MRLRTRLAILAILISTLACAAQAQSPTPADIVFVNGKVFTADDGDRVVQGFAVAGDRFVAIGTDSEEPSSDDFTCAGMSSAPSIVCVQYGASSGTAPLKYVSRSARTSGLAFSFNVSDADVWRMNTCSSPTRSCAISGSAASTSRVTR